MRPPTLQGYLDTPYPTLSSDQLDALIERHDLHVALEDVRPLASTGIVHTIYALGDHLVLRVPKDHPEAVLETYTGVLATPLAHATGISTPALVAFDDERDIAPVPLSVFEPAAGEPMTLGTHPQDLGVLWHALGRDLATLHENVRECPDPDGYLDHHAAVSDHRELLATLEAEGVLGTDAATWLHEVLERLRPSMELADSYRRFIHGDVSPSNMLAVGARYSALIDWDDAGWADPAMELRTLPLRAVDSVLAGYRSVMPIDGDETAEQRILWDKITGALRRLRRPPRPKAAVASATPAGPLIELFASAVDSDVPILRLLRR